MIDQHFNSRRDKKDIKKRKRTRIFFPTFKEEGKIKIKEINKNLKNINEFSFDEDLFSNCIKLFTIRKFLSKLLFHQSFL